MFSLSRAPRETNESKYFHIMIRGNDNKKIFIDDMDKEKLLLIVKKYADENLIILIAYCVLDTHSHFLMKVQEQDISTVMKKINVSYAYYYNDKYNSRGHVFCDRFQSASIKDVKYLLPVIRYIHSNSYGYGAKNEHFAYKWSSYGEYTKCMDTFLSNTDALTLFGKTVEEAIQNFIKYANAENNDIFLDVEESIDYKINKMIERYLYKYNIQLQELGYKQNKQHRINLVLMLRDTGKLSIRKIGCMLNVNRGIVYNILKEFSEDD